MTATTNEPWRDVMQTYATYRRMRNAHPDLASFHTRRYEVCCDLLGIDLALRPTVRGPRHLHQLLDTFADAYASVSSPFADFLESPPIFGEIYRDHGATINARVDELKECYLEVMVDCASRLWGPCPRRITPEVMTEHGVGRDVEPCELDYW